jgi:hypothetical protein
MPKAVSEDAHVFQALTVSGAAHALLSAVDRAREDSGVFGASPSRGFQTKGPLARGTLVSEWVRAGTRSRRTADADRARRSPEGRIRSRRAMQALTVGWERLVERAGRPARVCYPTPPGDREIESVPESAGEPEARLERKKRSVRSTMPRARDLAPSIDNE